MHCWKVLKGKAFVVVAIDVVVVAIVVVVVDVVVAIVTFSFAAESH